MLGSMLFYHTSAFRGTSAVLLLLRSQGSGQPQAAPRMSTSPASGSSHVSGSWNLTLLLIDFLVIQGPVLFQKCRMGGWARPAVTMATNAHSPLGGLG